MSDVTRPVCPACGRELRWQVLPPGADPRDYPVLEGCLICTYQDREPPMSVGLLMQWLAGHDPESEIAFAFRSNNGVLWRYANELGVTLTYSDWTGTPVVEIDTFEFELVLTD
mgnify:FL=1